jgi:hypothetical protein
MPVSAQHLRVSTGALAGCRGVNGVCNKVLLAATTASQVAKLVSPGYSTVTAQSATALMNVSAHRHQLLLLPRLLLLRCCCPCRCRLL